MTKEFNFDFMRYTRVAVIFTAVLTIGTIVALAARGLNFGIDFTGGTLVELGYEEAPNLNDIREVLEGSEFGRASVQRFGAPTDVLVRLPPTATSLGSTGLVLSPRLVENEFETASGSALQSRVREIVGNEPALSVSSSETSDVFTFTAEGVLDLAYVRADRKGDGLAGRLHDEILSRAMAAGLTVLTVEASHLMRRFLEKRGWSLIETQTVRRNDVAIENHKMSLSL